jgi:hypothetical protein
VRRDLVVFGEREHRRLLAPHPHSRVQAGNDGVTMGDRRGADDRQVGRGFPQHLVDIVIGGGNLPAFGDGTGAGEIDVDDRADPGLGSLGPDGR